MPDNLLMPEGSEAFYSQLSPNRRNLLLNPLLNGIQDYVEMAYGTPHEPFLKGDLAYGNTSPQQESLAAAPPTQVEPTQEYQQRYAEIYRRSLRDPVLAHALDFSKLGMMPSGSRFPDSTINGRVLTSGQNVLGMYYPLTDVAISSPDPSEPVGITDVHELLHRGMRQMGVPLKEHHDIMRRYDYVLRQDAPLYPRFDAPFIETPPEQYDWQENMRIAREVRDKAQRALSERRPFGGPR
jgi:hypothetical protein